MQEKSPLGPPEPSIGPGCMNTITTIGLCLFLPFAALNVLAPDDSGSPSFAWENASNALKSGILYLDGFGSGVFAFLFFLPLGVWGFVALVWSLVEYWQKKTHVKKLVVVWAGILFGVTLFMAICFLYVGSLSCIDGYCALPVHPGVVIPTPVPSR